MSSVRLLFLTWIAIVVGILFPAHIVENAPICRGNAIAYNAFKSTENLTVHSIPAVGYEFYKLNQTGGPNVTNGLIIIPAEGVAPISYAPYAQNVAAQGYYVAIVRKATTGLVLELMILHSELPLWAIAGHGTGGKLAATITLALQPRIKSLILIAAPVPQEVDLRSINVFVVVIYGANDTINAPPDVENSFSRLRGDAFVTKFGDLGYYDFAYSTCIGNVPAPDGGNSSALSLTVTASILYNIVLGLRVLVWFQATPRALSFGNNHFLTPGFNDSKPYPGDVRVRFDQVDVPGTNPKRHWWVFTPTYLKGGIIYFSGAAVEGRAYFSIAFQIAARGHLVVIPEAVARFGTLSLTDATAIIDSDLPIFSGVPKSRWAVAGHSAGGYTASVYAGCYGNKVYGAVMHAGGWFYNANTSEVPVLQLYGNLDANGSQSFHDRFVGFFNPSATTFQTVVGANHLQTPDCVSPPNDIVATIGIDDQQTEFANMTVTYLDSLESKAYSPVLYGLDCVNGFPQVG